MPKCAVEKILCVACHEKADLNIIVHSAQHSLRQIPNKVPIFGHRSYLYANKVGGVLIRAVHKGHNVACILPSWTSFHLARVPRVGQNVNWAPSNCFKFRIYKISGLSQSEVGLVVIWVVEEKYSRKNQKQSEVIQHPLLSTPISACACKTKILAKLLLCAVSVMYLCYCRADVEPNILEYLLMLYKITQVASCIGNTNKWILIVPVSCQQAAWYGINYVVANDINFQYDVWQIIPHRPVCVQYVYLTEFTWQQICKLVLICQFSVRRLWYV